MKVDKRKTLIKMEKLNLKNFFVKTIIVWNVKIFQKYLLWSQILEYSINYFDHKEDKCVISKNFCIVELLLLIIVHILVQKFKHFFHQRLSQEKTKKVTKMNLNLSIKVESSLACYFYHTLKNEYKQLQSLEDHDNYFEVSAVIDGINNRLLFITYYKNISVFELNTF
ncbi:hypothetical protein RFI_28968 [Reticulomyxa filosa]|uniref:Transmembrane protein n=1 Tax=Reticulomyxa filosa TaxID=46433 RepID=X6M379_RETFI|nr:hypothetical protein RFI_28968 [Reticulomyxa filosa]|eukprot:ETO08418.1 hypothetical protein RFI_28968 [Reticulomyxa filosa]